MNILVMGAGAVGCYYGAMLARAGHAVTLVARARHVDAIRREGLLFESAAFTGRIPIGASTTPEAARDADLVLFCVKSGDTESAGEMLLPFLHDKACVLSLQNGVDNAERLSKVLCRNVIPAIVYLAVGMPGDGHLRHHGRGELVIGRFDDAARIAAVLDAAKIPTQVSDDVVPALWDKLIINCAFNAMSAIPQIPYGKLVASEGVVAVMHDVIRECLAVARAAGVAGLSDPYLAVNRIAGSMATQRSSTAQDLAAGKPTEIDHLNGYVVRLGETYGVATPVNGALRTLVHLMELRST
ncbi:ketopantoate reductase [Panacagrimonas perspica]|uniref:2-dehydropantoate 2-reductase n=1 Tax=Panacagrimonas perspica TaxID=381431 RepID=A0A4R7PAA2_9GAMM|nr:ketopantoate reductase family protein [Panacagrimonas perspica]TDU30955.1 ketopantoate reductase [Panacagrimonas perspica]THD01894.1 2-dehydropantoate 2-reductase [Panacagrimonas perspica]